MARKQCTLECRSLRVADAVRTHALSCRTKHIPWWMHHAWWEAFELTTYAGGSIHMGSWLRWLCECSSRSNSGGGGEGAEVAGQGVGGEEGCRCF